MPQVPLSTAAATAARAAANAAAAVPAAAAADTVPHAASWRPQEKSFDLRHQLPVSAALLLHCCCSDDARMCPPVAAERRLDCARMRCRGQEGTLPGCSNDAKCIEYMLKHRFGFRVVSGGVGAQQLGARQAVSAVPRLASTHYGGWLAAAFCQPSAALLPFSSLSYSFLCRCRRT